MTHDPDYQPRLDIHELKFLLHIRAEENNRLVMKPVMPERTACQVEDLRRRGYIRFEEVLTMFYTPTGEQFAVLTEAGLVAMAVAEKLLNAQVT